MEKAGLRFGAEFVWAEEVLKGWTEEERRGVKYNLLDEQDMMIADDRSLIACAARHTDSLLHLALQSVRSLENWSSVPGPVPSWSVATGTVFRLPAL
jgi:hypothetical protein